MPFPMLLVEDDQLHREMLEEVLSDKGYEVASAATGQQAIESLSGQEFRVALVDIRLPDVDGISLLNLLHQKQPTCSVLLMTGQATVEAAVDAMKLGAHDYLAKPFRMELLLLKLARLFHLKKLEEENRKYRTASSQGEIIGNSQSLRRVLNMVESVAPTDASVIIQGESGTGKELVADLLHTLSPRACKPLVRVNCGAIPEGLLESELFGYEKGAFTGAGHAHLGYLEQAHEGTLFLDEVGEIPQAMQVKLLRVLQDHRIQRLGAEKTVPANFRLVAATHRNLEELRSSGTIREDFFYRLNVIPLLLPPLRERREDLPLLLAHFIKIFSERYNTEPVRFSPSSIDVLNSYPFPGNIRELANLAERLQVLFPGSEINPGKLPQEIRNTSEFGSEIIQCFRTELPLREALGDFEIRFIQKVLEEERGNRTTAARRLGISRKSLWEKLSHVTPR